MLRKNAMGNRKTESRTRLLQREKWIEDVVAMLGRDSASVIPHADFDLIPRPACLHGNFSALWHGLRRVDDQIEQHLLELFRVAFNRRHLGRHIDPDVNVLVSRAVRGQTRH